MAVHYGRSLITAEAAHQQLATGFEIGTRFHSAPVIRYWDAKRVQLGHTIKADGRWRLLAFAGADDTGSPGSRLGRLCEFLAESPDSPIRAYTPRDADIDAVIDVRGIVQRDHRELAAELIPPLLVPQKGRLGLRDYEKLFCAEATGEADIYDQRGIDRANGCIVIVRPDQFVADVLPLDAFSELGAFFDRFMIPASAPVGSGSSVNR
jgi:phenol 2-monooxygenase